jgi:hypothetical protein
VKTTGFDELGISSFSKPSQQTEFKRRKQSGITMTSFLDNHVPLGPQIKLPAGLKLRGLYLGLGNPALEVLVLDADTDPRIGQVRAIWSERHGGRAAPLLVVALRGDTASICGPAGEEPPLRRIETGQAERLCIRALEEPDRNAALRFIHDALPGLETELPGIRNEGMLSNHELARGARLRADWATAQARASPLLGDTGMALLRQLGFAIEKADGVTSLLRAGSRDRAIAVLLDAGETPEGGALRFQNLSPVSWALTVADRRNLPWVIVVQGDRIRLYPVELGVGVGRRGRTETWIELRTSLMRQDQAALLWLIFSTDALQPQGTLEEMLETSKRFAADLAIRLRERIYDRVIPGLATGIAKARGIKSFSPDDLRLTYTMAVTVMFRLLFIAYAEDRDLLPFSTNDAYKHRALKTKARELADNRAAPGSGSHLWQEVNQLFDAIRDGDAKLGVPAYGGGLFETNPDISKAGAELGSIVLQDTVFEPALRALLLDETRDLGSPGLGPVDFRSLRVREFGTIYEGLLESELAVADTDLVLKKQGKDFIYVPAKAKDSVIVKRGETYLHNRSGARKSSGSYFTPSFAVDHLLDSALDPALTAHKARLASLDDTDAAEAFFDIRIADIAMGSGHFLVAAVDRVEKVLTEILADTQRPLLGVMAELATLRAAALSQLKKLGLEGTQQIEDGQLLRRLIARRCIYGVDLNPLAVDLARLSIWIHSFVPGLPLSLLDHALVQGNALVGIATIRQLEERFAASGTALFPVDAQSLLGEAAEPLKLLAKLADATTNDIHSGRLAMEQARIAVGPTKALCDLVVAERIAPEAAKFQFENWQRERQRIQANPALARARKTLEGLDVFHFPIAFPEVFLRRRPGFDVILGNPPWQEVTIEAHAFWARHFPGLRGLPARQREMSLSQLPIDRPDLQTVYEREAQQIDRERKVLSAGFFPGMTTGELDLYKAFTWRFFQLAAEDGGRIGVVLPRGALSALGSEMVRRALFEHGSDVFIVTLTNRTQWVFSEVHPQATFALVAVARGKPVGDTIRLQGPFANRIDFDAGKKKSIFSFSAEAVLNWTSSASLPLLPSDTSIGVFAQLRTAPRLDVRGASLWRARPVRELHATDDKPRIDFSRNQPPGFWPVYKGESFDSWQPDHGLDSYYAWGDPDKLTTHLFEKRLRAGKAGRDSAYREFSLQHLRDPSNMPHLRPRIAFRDATNRTNIRTVCVSLVPPKVFLSNQANFFLWPRGDEKDEAFLLGVLSSIPLDWYARRFVETHVNLFIINPFPVPRPERTDNYWRRAVEIAGRLACPDERFSNWAKAVGVEYGPLVQDKKQKLIEELDAVVAKLYGLAPDHFIHIFDTFHEWTEEAQQKNWNARRDRTVAILRSLP